MKIYFEIIRKNYFSLSKLRSSRVLMVIVQEFLMKPLCAPCKSEEKGVLSRKIQIIEENICKPDVVMQEKHKSYEVTYHMFKIGFVCIITTSRLSDGNSAYS